MRTSTVQQKKDTQAKSGLLSARLFNAIPYSNSVWGLYNRTKQSNDVLKFGLDFAENMVVSLPGASKVQTLDRFAGSQIAKIEDKLGVDLVAKSVGAVAYPIGYSLGLAQYARNKAMDIASPAIEMSYEIADVLVDKLLPGNDETLEDEYRKMSLIQQKSPMRRIRDRTTISSMFRLPSTAFALSMNMFQSSLYMGMGFASMSLERMILSATSVIDTINMQFEQDLKRPWAIFSNGDLTKLYKATLFYGVKYVNGLIDEIEQQATELTTYLEERSLPYNSKVVEFTAHKLKGIERRLIRLGGIKFMPAEQTISFTKTVSRKAIEAPVKRGSVTPQAAPAKRSSITPRQRDQPELRQASIITGEQSEQVEKSEQSEVVAEVPALPIEEEDVTEITADSQKRKERPQIAHDFYGDYLLYKESHDRRTKPHTMQPKKSNRHRHAKKDAKEVPAGIKPIEADASVPSGGYIMPMIKAQELAEEMVFKQYHKTHAKPVAPRPKVENNPFGDISVEDDGLLRGPELEDAHVIKAQDFESRAHEHRLRTKTLHQLLTKLADVKSKEEKRAENHQNWEVPKHAAHHAHIEKVHNNSEVPIKSLPKNNPFGKLHEVSGDQDPFTMMGVSSM